MKYDYGKTPIHLIPPEAIEIIADVFAYGAEKYSVNDWRLDGGTTEWSRSYSSIQRHLTAFWSGEDLDPESNKSHIAHAMTQIIVMMIHILEHPEMDDRYTTLKEKHDSTSK